MLAVSGSVEAARAGESGRGFAIVSNDIRGLAREASANVERAKDTVRGVLEQIAVLKSDLEQIAASAEIEVENNRAVSAVLTKLGDEVAEMRSANKSIVRGAAEILAAAAESATGRAPGRRGLRGSQRSGSGSRHGGDGAVARSRGPGRRHRGDRLARRRAEARRCVIRPRQPSMRRRSVAS